MSHTAQSSSGAGGKRSGDLNEALGRAKKMNDAIHSPMKVPPPTTEGATMDDVMDVLRNQICAKMATKQDLKESEARMERVVKEKISEAIDPVKDELVEIRADLATAKKRVADLEANSNANGSSSHSKEINELMRSMDALDINHKRIAFLGFPDSCQADHRIKEIERLINDKVQSIKPVRVQNSYKGPYSDRKLTRNAYAEYASVEEAKKALKALTDVKFEVNGENVIIKLSRSKLQSNRNFALRKAEEILKPAGVSKGAAVVLNWEDRAVTVGGNVAFKQEKKELSGKFMGGYAHLSLP